ncbi:hypothetical protein RJ640_007998 [Escallonia rubra]|uniref:Uncharacterized protein n=1 Tax=Escallonia rubra TaxID=112253 RepID=A0AA88UU15_9ASTE|nr:hypothetical protein RJ640_007998 [Escallonia rubra]
MFHLRRKMLQMGDLGKQTDMGVIQLWEWLLPVTVMAMLWKMLGRFSGWDNFQEIFEEVYGNSEKLYSSGRLLHDIGTEEDSTSTTFSRSQSLGSRGSLMRSRKSVEMTRPFPMTDKSRFISRGIGDSTVVGFDEKDELNKNSSVCLEENRTLLGAPSVQPVESEGLPQKPKQSHCKCSLSRFGSRVSGGPFHAQGSSTKYQFWQSVNLNMTLSDNISLCAVSSESSDGMLLFFLGIAMGISATVVARKREVEKLQELLRRTENLVEDLQEELEMKDMVTVKEFANENYQSQGTNHHASYNKEVDTSSSLQKLDEPINNDVRQPIDQKEENPELMSKIEAELEAELERLELNLQASSLETISDYVELDPDFHVDVVQGDLKLDVGRRQPGGPFDSEQDTSGTANNHTDMANYAVSPWQLSFRLHEVIESRLQARIEELETALQNSQNTVPFLESQNVSSRWGFVRSEVGSSSTPESPNFVGEDNERSRPLAANMSRESLDVYNVACREMSRMTETNQDADALSNGNHVEGQDCEENDSFAEQGWSTELGSL